MSPANLYQPNQQPVFLGREVEMGLLRAAFDSACAGRGGVVLLSGEPGIGKTRTAEELATQAFLRKAQVYWGRCYEGEGAPAFWPWVQILRAYTRSRTAASLLVEMQAGAADIVRLVPEIRERLPQLSPVPTLDDDQTRFRLFDHVTVFLTRATQTQPLLLILDDLHWADTPSLLLLQFLAQELSYSSMLIIGTYRDVEVGQDHPLIKTVTALSRLRVGLNIPLGGLGAAEVARFMKLTIGQTPSEPLLATILAETAGNPFFMTELAHLWARSDEAVTLIIGRNRAIPPTVRGTIRQRLNRLSAACNRVLNSAAIIGRDFSLNMLLRLGDVTQDTLLSGLDEAVNAHLVTPIPGATIAGRYRFVHALVRETLYEELAPIERVTLHQRVGAMLEGLYPADPEAHLAELAHHFTQAAPLGDIQKALDYTMRAAARNMRLLAYEEAVRHYERALYLLGLQEQEEPHRRCELLLALGQAQTSSGETAQARTTFAQAAELARGSQSGPDLAQAALGFAGGVVTPGVVDEHVIALLNEALSALGEANLALRVRLLGRLAMEYRFASLPQQREELSRQAVELARRLDDRSALVFALNARHFAILAPDTLEQRLAVSIELAQLAEESGDRELALRSLPWRLADLLDLGHVHAADEAIEKSARLATELRQPLYLWYVNIFQALRALMKGEFSEGERLASVAHTLGQRVQPGAADVYFAAQMFVLRREQGRLQEVEQLILDILKQYPAMPVIRCMLIQIYCHTGRPTAAQAELTHLCTDQAAVVPKDQLWLGAITFLAEAATLLADRASAAILYDLLMPYTQRNVIVGVPICLGSAATYLGCLAATLERWPAAAPHFEDALAFNTKLGLTPFLAWTQYYYGTMLRRRNLGSDYNQAAKLLDQAQTTARALGMSHLAEQIQQLQIESPAQRSSSVYPAGLTSREVEVIRLIAAGNSTKEIAAALVISVPTVERHITHIYEKIGAGSRAEATAYALRHGLA